MKGVITIFLILIFMIDPTKIGTINKIKAEARTAFNEGNYKQAIVKFKSLIDQYEVTDDEVTLNLANAYYLAKDTAQAKPLYQQLTQSTKNDVKSNALMQLGLMNNVMGKSEDALAQFKQAIKADPTNQDARFNYEMLKKKLDDIKRKQDEKEKGPSEFAKKIKEQADQLVAKNQYENAVKLMKDAYGKDQTISYYGDYITRLTDVFTIDASQGKAPGFKTK